MRAVVAAALVALTACGREPLGVAKDGEAADDYGQADLMAAVATAAATPTSPAAFRALAVRIEELRPRFNRRVADQAELQLAFLALGPLRAQLTATPEAQLEALATTVWPTAFRVEPKPGETPRQYLERICTGELGGECKYVVPEAWSVIMAAKAWRRMKTRAREAYGNCLLCGRDPTYQAVLEDYDRHDTAWQARVKTLGDGTGPGFWPRAGGHAAPWREAPVLELGIDVVKLDGEALGDDEWRRALVERRGDRRVLGVHLRPRQEVRVLRSALVDAARAGWTEVALQVRGGQYPYPLLEYRLRTTRRGAPATKVRDVDTIQLLVQGLDAAAARIAARDDGQPALLSL